MNLLDWAQNEIKLACERERKAAKQHEEWDYGCACYDSAFRAFKSLIDDNHSEMSINITKKILNRLIDCKPLTPIEDTDDVWSDIADISGLHGEKANYQCKRMSSLFKYVYDNGVVKYHDNDRIICVNINNTSSAYYWGFGIRMVDELIPITMPYIPNNNPIKLFIEDFPCNDENGDFDTVGIFYALKPTGEKIEINRYFKEINREFIEITEDEYTERRKSVFSNIDTERTRNNG